MSGPEFNFGLELIVGAEAPTYLRGNSRGVGLTPENPSPTQLPSNSLAERAGGWGLLPKWTRPYLAMFLSVLSQAGFGAA